MKEYAVEEGKKVDWRKLVAPPLSREVYMKAHQSLPIACHDVLIDYRGGILLVVRDNFPAKNILWMIGGRINKGMPILESLQKKVKQECGLKIDNIVGLGTGRTLFDADPFGHGKGTDTINIMFYASGKGKLKLDPLHRKPVIITPAQYTATFRKSLHPYVRDFMDKAMKLVGKK